MPFAGSLIGFADFSAALPIDTVTERLSDAMFAGLRFIPDEHGSWDEIPCLCLERDFLGMRVVLGGSEEEGYSIELCSILGSILGPVVEGQDLSVCDLSKILMDQLSRIPGIILKPPAEG